jgi:predicted nucleotidyltransferase component of viral defense system
MKKIVPRQPSQLSLHAQACLNALVYAKLAEHISLGGALGLFHYLDYRSTHDVDAWWSVSTTESQKREVTSMLQKTLSEYGETRIRAWGDVVSVELLHEGKVTFSFQIAGRSILLEKPASAGWIDIPLDSLADLVASKMIALIERGAPRDFLDIYTLCHAEVVSIDECWSLWKKRQSLAGSETDTARAHLAIETHLERIALHRPIEQITDPSQREQAQQVRKWYSDLFLKEI